jgi:two-component system phosphate regulon sensor histidine kinase PhoR
MIWLIIGLALAIALVGGIRVWRRWIDPWREAEELVADVLAGRPPRKFLMTANARAQKIGLDVETIAKRLDELDRTAREGTLSVQTILGALPDGLVVVDDGGRIQMINPQFSRYFGEDGRGETLFEATRDASVDRLLSVTLREGAPQQETLSISGSAGDRTHLEVSAVPFARNSRGVSGAVVLFRDITHVRQVEEMRRDFVANVSHELRTPLSIFRGYLETLLDDPKQPTGELVRILEVMERHSERLTTLVDDVLSLARLEAPDSHLDLGEISLQPLLTEILHDWEKRFSAKQLRAELDVSADLPPLLADEGRIQEVIYNLLDNAVKYSQPGGQINVRAERVGEQVRVSVSDQGVGIPGRELPRIFERFYRADKARSRELGGTGLGLSIVKHIAQLHGGSVEAASEVGRGTTISFHLPLAPVSRGVSVTES